MDSVIEILYYGLQVEVGGNIRKTVGYLSYTKDKETLTASMPEEMSIWDKSEVLRGSVITIMVLLPLAVIAGVLYRWMKKHRRERNRLLKCKLLNIHLSCIKI